MTKLRFLLPLLGALLLGGCISGPQPVPKGYVGPLATIADTSAPVSSTKIYYFELEEVDGREVLSSSMATMRTNQGRGFYMEPVLEARQVPAGPRKLKIGGYTVVAAPILAFGGKMYSVSGEVDVTLEADKTYRVKGVLSKEYCGVWLEDSAGTVVSPKIEKGKKP